MSPPPVPRSQEILLAAPADMPPLVYSLLGILLTLQEGCARALEQPEEARLQTLRGLEIAAGKGVAECMGFRAWDEPEGGV